MVNYQEDVRFGKEILARVVESYRKIRNTWRFMLGVLADFDPQHDPSESPPFSELDLYILQKLQQVKEKALQAYRNYEYYTVYHALFNFFTVDLSAFYLNVQKDNLYCNLPAAPARRTAQAVVFKLLVESLQLLAPVLSFTCEEAWQFVPAFRGKEGSVHLCRFPAGEPRFRQAVDEATWERLLALRDRALKEIEEARNRKLIGDSLEAELHIGAPGAAPGADLALLRQHRDLLQAMLVVSGLRLEESAVETIRVAKAEGRKCPRCWNWFTGKTAKGKHPELCPRCRQVAKEIRLEPRG